MELNSTVDKHTEYICSMCGKAYPTIEERAKCELRDIEKAKKEKAEREKAEKENKKNADRKEIEAQFKVLEKMLNTYIDNYGEFKFENSDRFISSRAFKMPIQWLDLLTSLL